MAAQLARQKVHKQSNRRYHTPPPVRCCSLVGQFQCTLNRPIIGVTIIFAPPPSNIRYGLTVLIYNSGHFGPPLPFWAPAPGIVGAADG